MGDGRRLTRRSGMLLWASAAFEALGKTEQYAVILKLATARTATARGSQLKRAMASLQGELKGG